MIDSRCGLHCTTCTYKEPCGCGGCIETNGHPFHGACPVAQCCQKKAFTTAENVRNCPVSCYGAIHAIPSRAIRRTAHAWNSAEYGARKRKENRNVR